MNDFTAIEQFDTSALADFIFGEDGEIIGYFTSEDAEEFFSDSENEFLV